jgi:vesicle transport protein SEC22
VQVLFKKLSTQRNFGPERLSAEAGAHTFHVLNQAGVCFLTLAERSYPKKLAYQYLEELANEFNRLYGGNQVDNVSRPYAFIKFGACLPANSIDSFQHFCVYQYLHAASIR